MGFNEQKTIKEKKNLEKIKSEEKLRFKTALPPLLFYKRARGLAAMTSPLQGESRRFKSDRAH